MSLSSPIATYYKEQSDLNSLSGEDLSYGAVGSLVSLSTGYGAMKGSEYAMEAWGIKNLEPQTYFRLYESLNQIASGLLRGILKALAVVYVAFLVPIIEEWVFRDLLYKWQESEVKGEEGMGQRFYRVIANGMIFGAFHFSLLQGFANIPIVIVSTIAGIVFAMLRELRGDRWASTVAHSLNNSFVLGINFLRI